MAASPWNAARWSTASRASTTTAAGWTTSCWPLETASEDGELGPVVLVRTTGTVRGRPVAGWWPYGSPAALAVPAQEQVPITAVPYFAWGNRAEGAMRVWVPTA